MNHRVLALGCLMLVSGPAFAQEDGGALFSVSGGVSFPSQPDEFSKYWKMGPNAGGALGYAFTPAFSLNAAFDYQRFPLDGETLLNSLAIPSSILPGVAVDGGAITMITVIGYAKASLTQTDERVSPFLLFGGGFFAMSASAITVSQGGSSATITTESASAFSILFGTGLDIPVGETNTIFLQVAYGIGFTEGKSTRYLPIKAGVTLRL